MGRTDLLRDAAAAGLSTALSKTLGKTYGILLTGTRFKDWTPVEPQHLPIELRQPDDALLEHLLRGDFPFAGGRVRIAAGTPWEAAAPNDTWAEEVNGFGWLRHFAARNDAEVTRHACWLVTTWIRSHHQYSDLQWAPHVIGRRLRAWLANWPLIARPADEAWRRIVLAHMARQASHLANTFLSAPNGFPRIEAAGGLALTALALIDDRPLAERTLEQLGIELGRQILPDGGHISRSPEIHLETYLLVLSLEDLARHRGVRLPVSIRNALDRMAPMIPFFRHGDGRLALFNGASEGPPLTDDQRLYPIGGKECFSHARHSGYQRVEAGTARLFLDVGTPPPVRYGGTAHMSALAFELSIGSSRLVTNCGVIDYLGPEWRTALRQTAAHSAASLADDPTGRVLNGSLPGRLIGASLVDGASEVTSQRFESDGGVLIEGSHDAYRERFGLLQERRLFLNGEGTDLRGEDRFVEAEGETAGKTPAPPPILRFHLHPDVRASQPEPGGAVELALSRGERWAFRALGAPVTLETSVYLGAGTAVEPTVQIVMRGDASASSGTGAVFKWKFHRTGLR